MANTLIIVGVSFLIGFLAGCFVVYKRNSRGTVGTLYKYDDNGKTLLYLEIDNQNAIDNWAPFDILKFKIAGKQP